MTERTQEAQDILRQLGFPRQQQNLRSALTMLALLDIGPDDAWKSARNPMLGITPMMHFFKEKYGKSYAPNSRETVRRHTVHQFLQAALIVANPGMPDLPVNSSKTVYQISPDALRLLQRYGTAQWEKLLRKYTDMRPSLQQKYDSLRRMRTIPLRLPSSGNAIRMSSGRHSRLVAKICEEFVGRFVRGSRMFYVGDTTRKFAYFDMAGLERLGIFIDAHGKMPDVIIYDSKRKWIFLIEAVTSHGPVDAKRREELCQIFSGAKAGLVYVTAFEDRQAMRKYAADIAWETEVRVADSPDHMIHFDGKRCLGP